MVWCSNRVRGVVVVVIVLLAAACTNKTIEEPPVITGDALPETTSLETGNTSTTPGASSTTTPSTAPARQPTQPIRTLPPQDLELFASEIGAQTLVVRPKFLDDPRTIVVFQDGESLEYETDYLGASSDGRFIYSAFGEGCCMLASNASTMDGQTVCEAESPFHIHHATRRNDGTYVMGIEPVDDGMDMEEVGIPHEATGLVGVPAFAEDCETGERIPIEPFTLRNQPSEASRWVQVVRPAGKVFHIDHEFPAARLTTESGRNLSGDDIVDVVRFSQDGSIAVYTDKSGLAPRTGFSEKLVSRNTETGELVWWTDLGRPILFHHLYGDRVVVGLPGGSWLPHMRGEPRNYSAIVLNAATGTQITDAFLLETDLLFVG